MCVKLNTTMSVLGLDLSKAFDSINRTKLLEIIKPSLTEDEFRIIHLLLSDSTARIKIVDDLSSALRVTRGVPQGDSLSPLLAVLYFQKMVESLHQFLMNPQLLDIIFADDIDLLHQLDDNHLDDLVTAVTTTFAKWDMTIQIAKTEKYLFSRNRNQCRNIEKLGVLIERDDDFTHRILRSWTKFKCYYSIWHSAVLSIDMKVRIYKKLVFPSLTYAIGASAYTQLQLNKLESAHRQQLRHAINIHYPNIITNKKLYMFTKSVPLRLFIIHQRWSLLYRHIQAESSPIIHNSILDYFVAKPQWKGTLITLPKMFIYDLASIKVSADPARIVDILSNLASSKQHWDALVQLMKSHAFHHALSSSSFKSIIYKLSNSKSSNQSALAFLPRPLFLASHP